MEPGIFQLRSASDLFKKLEWEYENLRAHPGNAYHAFNFCITAEHMLDWTGKKILKLDYPLLRLCSHLANGAKHIDKLKSHDKSVKSAKHDSVFESGVYEDGVFEESLQITLEPEEARALNMATIDVVLLASNLLEFWRAQI